MKKIRARLEILSLAEIVLLHQSTLEVLAEVGCRLPNRRLLALLEVAGAEVDLPTARVRFPPSWWMGRTKMCAGPMPPWAGARWL